MGDFIGCFLGPCTTSEQVGMIQHPKPSMGKALINRHRDYALILLDVSLLIKYITFGRQRSIGTPHAGWSEVSYPPNVRDRVLTADEFQRMLIALSNSLRPVLVCAYHPGVRKEAFLGPTGGSARPEQRTHSIEGSGYESG
jgi:hypothetical protein